MGSPQLKENIFFFGLWWGTRLSVATGSGLLNFSSIFGSFRCQANSRKKCRVLLLLKFLAILLSKFFSPPHKWLCHWLLVLLLVLFQAH